MIIAYWNNKSINIGKERLLKVHDRDLLEPETIIIILIGTAFKVLEEGGLW
jgi:hypothetical protein